MYAPFQQGLIRGHIRIVLATLAGIFLILVLFHLHNKDVTLDAIKFYEQDQANHTSQDQGSSGHQLQQQDKQSWYSTIIQQLQPKQYCNAAQNDICTAVQQREHAENSKKIVRRIESLMRVDPSLKWSDYDTVAPAEPEPEDHLFSRMHYRRSCYDAKLDAFRPSKTGRGVQLIESLWGMLRDPFDAWCGEQRLMMPDWDGSDWGQNTEAIMPMGFAPYAYDLKATSPIELDDDSKRKLWRPHGIPLWHSHLTPSYDPHTKMTVYEKPQNIFVELGSSYFGAWGGITVAVENPAAASGKYFYETYHGRGQPFSKYIAVEVAPLDAAYAQSQLPREVVGIYKLINAPLTMDDGDTLNTVDIIKRISKPGDFFVIKIDIDMAPIEIPLIMSLLEDDPANGGASGNIDELMFEHHVTYTPMAGQGAAWGDLPVSEYGDLEYSYGVFRDLRLKGIRSHS